MCGEEPGKERGSIRPGGRIVEKNSVGDRPQGENHLVFLLVCEAEYPSYRALVHHSLWSNVDKSTHQPTSLDRMLRTRFFFW